MHIAQEIIHNIDAISADGVITLDYEGRFCVANGLLQMKEKRF